MGWKAHLETGIKSVLPAARRKFGALQQVGKMLPRSSRKLLSEGLVLSKLVYNITQWEGITQNHITTVQRFQNKLARWITGCGRRTRISSLLEQVGWYSISEQILMHSVTQMWKIVNQNRPETIIEELEIPEEGFIDIKTPRLQFTKIGF